jgi:small subunit ribosomal protein S1
MDDNFMTGQQDTAEESPEETMANYLDEPSHALKSVKRSDVVEGTVVAIDREEILVDIGLKSEAVLPLKELSPNGYGSLDEIHYNDTILVYVLQPETPEGHAIVSVRRASQERQWRVAQEMFERGDIIDAKVIESNKGGLIVNLDGVRGFVPISQIMNLKRDDSSENAETLGKLQAMVGKNLKLKIIEINRSRNRLILSERLAMQEWRTRRRDELMSELKEGDIRHGVVSNLAHFGAFVDLGGADGLVHISQLAWSRVNHPSEILHVGQEVEVQVLSIDKERKKIALSIKRAELDPWSTVEERYHVGQLVTGTITKIAPFGAFARIENGIEGLIHVTEIYPPTNDAKATLHEGQEVQVRVLRIESDRRRLGLSMREASSPTSAMPELSDDQLDQAYSQMQQDHAAADAIAEAPAPRNNGSVNNGTPAATPPAPAPAAASEDAPTTAFGAAFAQARTRQSDPAPTPEAEHANGVPVPDDAKPDAPTAPEA